MKNLKLTREKYLKAIELGYYEHQKCISVFEKVVKHYKLCGRTELLLINIKKQTPHKYKTAKYINRQTGEVHRETGLNDIGDAWDIAKKVCRKTGWNLDMFHKDVLVRLEK